MTSPILFVIFNRPDTTSEVFKAIRKAKPKQLFIVADGPRKGNAHDAVFCQKTRDVVSAIDWDCDVKKLFREENRGCKYGINEGISWFFEHVESGIILEDDCLPSESFFEYCDEMLHRYKDNEHVGVISGNNFFQEKGSKELTLPKDEYFFVAPVYTWGWATWRRAWSKQELEMETWPEAKKNKLLSSIFKNRHVVSYYSHTFDYSYSGRAKTWDAPWLYTCLKHNMLCLVPPRNLTSNIGVIGTTSRTEGALQKLQTEPITIQTLKHPQKIARNLELEDKLLTITDVDKASTRRDVVELLKKTKLDGLVRVVYKKLKLTF